MSMKRANGTGTVYKIKNRPLRRPYRAQVTVGWTDEGKAVRTTIGYFEKAAAAWNALREYFNDPAMYSVKAVTVGQCWEYARKKKVEDGVSAQTLGGYDHAATLIRPILEQPIADIRTPELQKALDTIEATATRRRARMVLTSAFDIAVRNDYVTKDYAALTVVPRQGQSTKHKPFKASEIAALWANMDVPGAKMTLVYLYTGIRAAELATIALENVDFDNRIMKGGVKTKAGRDRLIPIARCILPFVREMYEDSVENGRKTIAPNRWNSHKMQYMLAGMAEKVPGVGEHLPHDTRHTFVSMARAAGIDLYLLKTIVGHSTSMDVTDMYTHATVMQYVEAVDALPFGSEMAKNI